MAMLAVWKIISKAADVSNPKLAGNQIIQRLLLKRSMQYVFMAYSISIL
jgi:hypothetical protein